MQKIFPDAVIKGKDGFLSIRKEDMFYALVNAVKELDNSVQNLTKEFKNVIAEINKTNKKVNELEKENKELQARLLRIEQKIK